MTTLQQIELTCPVCETRFRSQAVVSTNSFGGKRTDFHERAAGTQPLPYLVHMCSRCGYAGSEKDFTEEAEITPTLREHVWNELAPKLHQSVLWHQQHGAQGGAQGGTTAASSSSSAASLLGNANASSSGSSTNASQAGNASQSHQTGTTGAVAAMVTVPGSEKYEAAARVAEWAGAEPRQVADLLLRAAWCCVDEGDVEAERYFRRRAAWAFEQALSAYDGVAREERAVLTYLVGELWRRVGDPRQARAWFEQVPHEITETQSQQWVLDASRQQKDAPREWFG
jgi:uncharacterized protein (DUF2225 family)